MSIDFLSGRYEYGSLDQALALELFEFAGALTKLYVGQPDCRAPAHVLFPQVAKIVQRYLAEKVQVFPPADLKDVFLAPYYGWVMENSARGHSTSG